MKKISFRVRNFDKEQFLTFNIDNNAELDEELLDFLEDEEPEGVVPVIFEEEEEFDTFSYDITDKIHLCELSNQEINSEMVLKVLRGLTISLMDMSEYRIPLSYLVLNRQYIYIDSDYKVEFVCIPLEDMKEEVDLTNFFRSFIASLRFDAEENGDYVAKLLTYINNRDMFNLHNLLDLIEEWMDRLGIEIPEGDSNEIYGEYQEIDETEDVITEDETIEDDNTQEAVYEEERAEEKFDNDILDEDDVPEETVYEDEVIEEDYAEETYAEENTAEEPVYEEETIAEDIVSESDTENDIAEEAVYEDEVIDEAVADEDVDEAAVDEDDDLPDSDNVSSDTDYEEEAVDDEDVDEAIAQEAVSDEEGSVEEVSEDSDDLSDEETSEEVSDDHEKKRTLFKTKEASGPVGVVIDDDFEAFLAEKEKEDKQLMQDESNIKIKKNIKINRASIVKNNQEELKAAEEEMAKEEAQKEAEETVEADIEQPEKDDKKETRRDRRRKNKEVRADGENADEDKSSSEDDKTAQAAKPASAPGPKVNPYLIRVNTDERIMITKQTFKIGKAGMGVDYTISGNGAISRVHAIITGKDGEYFIKDNKSTNHTFVNGKSVEEGENVELTDNCKIVLGDEEFIFKIQ